MADELDREIERAVEIGQDNEEVIQLARNWCGHLKVVKSGGTGLIDTKLQTQWWVIPYVGILHCAVVEGTEIR